MEEYLRMKNYDSMSQFERLIINAKVSSGAWKVYRMDFILRDGEPILINDFEAIVKRKK